MYLCIKIRGNHLNDLKHQMLWVPSYNMGGKMGYGQRGGHNSKQTGLRHGLPLLYRSKDKNQAVKSPVQCHSLLGVSAPYHDLCITGQEILMPLVEKKSSCTKSKQIHVPIPALCKLKGRKMITDSSFFQISALNSEK